MAASANALLTSSFIANQDSFLDHLERDIREFRSVTRTEIKNKIKIFQMAACADTLLRY
jgi:hypothetical protein